MDILFSPPGSTRLQLPRCKVIPGPDRPLLWSPVVNRHSHQLAPFVRQKPRSMKWRCCISYVPSDSERVNSAAQWGYARHNTTPDYEGLVLCEYRLYASSRKSNIAPKIGGSRESAKAKSSGEASASESISRTCCDAISPALILPLPHPMSAHCRRADSSTVENRVCSNDIHSPCSSDCG